MSDLLDVINTVRIGDLSRSDGNRDLQYDLDRRAARLGRKTGVAPMDWDEFNEATPAKKHEGALAHAIRWAARVAPIVTVVMAVVLTAGTLIPGVGLPALSAPEILVRLGAAAGYGALLGGFLSLVDDQKPEIRREQLGKYEKYLEEFEKAKGVSYSRSSQLDQSPVNDASTKWRDRIIEKARDNSHTIS
jgi:hypothetical protein